MTERIVGGTQLTFWDPQNRRVPTSKRRLAVLRLLADGHWHTTAEISSAEVGGSEGTRRLRELRREGYEIQKRRHSDQYEYRLDNPPTIRHCGPYPTGPAGSS